MTASHMAREIAEIPEAAARLATPEIQEALRARAAQLRADAPRFVGIIAHGSSRHAGAVIAHGIWHHLGLPCGVMPLTPQGSQAATAQLRGTLALGISQSGGSPDLVSAMELARAVGAGTLVVTNTPGSPLAGAAAARIDMAAGPEHAVAATKSFVNSVLAGLWLLGHWAEDQALLRGLETMPEALSGARADPDPELEARFTRPGGLFVLGRGASAGVAAEVALKAMELCGDHASAYSGGEVLHGPAAIARDGFSVIGFDGPDSAATLAQLAGQGADCMALPGVPPLHPMLDPLVQLIPVYTAIEAATRAVGRNPDRPEFLQKVTRTV